MPPVSFQHEGLTCHVRSRWKLSYVPGAGFDRPLSAARNAQCPHPVVISLTDGNGAEIAEVVEVNPIGLARAHRS
jgi:hypothetical protein